MKEHNLEAAQQDVVKSKSKKGLAALEYFQELAERNGNDDCSIRTLSFLLLITHFPPSHLTTSLELDRLDDLDQQWWWS